MSVKVKSDLKSTKQIEKKIIDNIEQSVNQIGEVLILGEARRNAPIDTGKLRLSGQTSGTDKSKALTDKKISIKVFFDTPYAAAQHENKNFKHPQGGRAFYLGDALKSNVDKAKQLIAKNFKKVRL